MSVESFHAKLSEPPMVSVPVPTAIWSVAIVPAIVAEPVSTICQLDVPSPSSLKNLEPPVSPLDFTAVPS